MTGLRFGIAKVERQAQRVPIAVLGQCAISECDIAGLVLPCRQRRCIIGIVGQMDIAVADAPPLNRR